MKPTLLASASALALLLAGPTMAQDATPLPIGANTEPATPSFAAEGFVISLNGDAIAGDPVVVDAVRRTDVQLANADVQVTFDGLGAVPRLDLELVGKAEPGASVTFQSALNYPAYVARGEVRIIDRAAIGGPRLIATLPVPPNGQISTVLPPEGDFVAVHRVYDAQGRFDETSPLPLSGRAGDAGIEGVEDGIDNTLRRGIPVSGGAVTVRGTDVAQGARVRVLGESVTPDGDGGFVLQRILPAGDYGVDVSVNGAGQNVNLVRDVSIPSSEWFYVATADLTYGIRKDSREDEWDTFTTGRLAGYVDGKTASGFRITGSADTGEGDIDDIFQRLGERDPRQLLLRVDPGDLYPTFGDDSQIVDATPTQGLLFLRIERDGNFVQWGNFDADLGDNAFVRNDRALYGLSAGYATAATTSDGEARGRLAFYGAQPDQIPNRDVFLGTGGSVFFLEQQDIAQATETISIQLRDGDTGRIIETRQLVAGQDYQINYIQGIVTLARPLQSAVRDGLFSSSATGDTDVVLIAAYEHTPLAGDVDGMAYGARAEGWVSDRIRLGISGQLDETGVTDHRVVGADVLFRLSETSFARLDYARSEGTGFDSTFSADGGLITERIIASGSDGEAIKLDVRVGLADLGLDADGAIGGYYEKRTEGFSSLDVNVTDVTGEELYYGLFADVALNDRLRVKGTLDAYENGVDETDTTGSAVIEYDLTPRFELAFGVEHTDRTEGTTSGDRTDVAAKLTFSPDDDRSVYVFGQNTVRRSGLPQNDRYGVGGSYGFGNGWSVEGEVSDGSLGEGARVLAAYKDEAGSDYYFGWELEPGRELGEIPLDGRDQGRFVAGGNRRVSDNVDVFGENTYDLFGRHRSLTSAYGVNYRPTEALSFLAAFEMGRVEDGIEYDFDRQAVSLGFQYDSEMIKAAGRVEYRIEEGLSAGTELDSETVLISADARIKLDEERRLLFSTDLATSDAGDAPLVDGDYADVTLGFAYRPIDNDRLNIVARYRYLYDLYGLRDADEPDEQGPQQRSHVVSVDASYDLDRRWTLGGKVGYRMSETAAEEGAPFTDNDAWLAVASARYHMPFEWDALIELRHLDLVTAQSTETSVLGALYKSVNRNVKVGVGYNFGSFSDDLTDLTYDDQGAFINLVASF